MDFATLRTMAKWRIDRAGHTQFPSTQIDYLLNEGFRRIYTEFRDQPFAQASTTITVTTSTATYSLPADCQEVRKIQNAEGDEIYAIEPTQYSATVSNDSYFFWGMDSSGNTTIRLIPSGQTGTYSVWYYKRPPTFTSATASTTLLPPDEWCDIPVLYAAMVGAQYHNDMQTFYALRKEYDQRFAMLRAQTWKKTGQNQTLGGMYMSNDVDWNDREIE